MVLAAWTDQLSSHLSSHPGLYVGTPQRLPHDRLEHAKGLVLWKHSYHDLYDSAIAGYLKGDVSKGPALMVPEVRGIVVYSAVPV